MPLATDWVMSQLCELLRALRGRAFAVGSVPGIQVSEGMWDWPSN